MKPLLIAPIIGCLVTTTVGYWLTSEPAPEAAPRATRSALRLRASRSAPAADPANVIVALATSATRPAAPAARAVSIEIYPAANAEVEPSTAKSTEIASIAIRLAAADQPEAKTEAASAALPTTRPVTPADDRPPMIASLDDDLRFVPTTRPETPQPQHPPESNDKNVDTGKPVGEWQRLTDDWGGLRPRLDDRGISFQASLTTDSSDVLSGGANTGGTAFRSLFNANVTLDADKLLGLKGGTFFANFQQTFGDNGSADVGALQSTSSIDVDGQRTQVSELWYEQLLLDDKVRIRVGKVDANGDFANAPDAGEFVNAAFGAAQTLLGFPSYPDPSTSVNVFVKPIDNLYLGAGVYDGSTQAGINTGSYGPAKAFDGGSHLFYIAEGGATWSVDKRDGRVGIGAWHHTANFDRLDGRGTQDGATGEYLVFDQCLFRANPEKDDDKRGLGFFLKYGHADGDISPIEHQISTGLAWAGMPGRDDDVIGAAVTCGLLSGKGSYNGGDETAYEVFYKLKLADWLSLKPDLQYVHNPGGGGIAGDAIVANLRVVIDF